MPTMLVEGIPQIRITAQRGEEKYKWLNSYNGYDDTANDYLASKFFDPGPIEEDSNIIALSGAFATTHTLYDVVAQSAAVDTRVMIDEYGD